MMQGPYGDQPLSRMGHPVEVKSYSTLSFAPIFLSIAVFTNPEQDLTRIFSLKPPTYRGEPE